MENYVKNTYGMNWISQHKRLAIYLRDGLACAYCGQSVEDGAALSLDHIRSRSKGGSNDESNLVTSCKRCNDSKNHRTLRVFAAAVSAYVNHGLSADDILAHVERCRRRSLKPHMDEAKRLITERGSASKALAHYR